MFIHLFTTPSNAFLIYRRYSREIDFPFDIDWTAIFVHTLYWHNDAVELLLLEAEDTEDNEETKTCNLIKRVVKIFLRHNVRIFTVHPVRKLNFT